MTPEDGMVYDNRRDDLKEARWGSRWRKGVKVRGENQSISAMVLPAASVMSNLQVLRLTRLAF
jgi:hypothetical protein